MAISNQGVWKWGGKHLLWVQVYGHPSHLGAHPEIFVLSGIFPDKRKLKPSGIMQKHGLETRL